MVFYIFQKSLADLFSCFGTLPIQIEPFPWGFHQLCSSMNASFAHNLGEWNEKDDALANVGYAYPVRWLEMHFNCWN